MSRANWTPPLRDLLKDFITTQTFDSLAAYLRAQFEATDAAQTAIQAERGLDDHTAIAPPSLNPDGIDGNSGVRWLRGPWLLNADGNVTGEAVLTARLTANVNNFAPLGIEKAIGIEFEANGNYTLSGVVASRQRRLLFLLNRSAYTITFPHENVASRSVNRFDLGDTGDTLVLRPGKLMWLYYDVQIERWHLFAIPAIAAADLPSALRAAETQFPPDYMWFAARINGNSTTWVGIGEDGNAITATSALFKDALYGIGRDVTTPAVAGNGVEVSSVATQQICPQHDPTRTVLIRTGADITNIRIWSVLTSANPTDADDMGGAKEYMGFRYSTVAGDPGWVGVTRNAATGQTVSTIVAAIAASTLYKLRTRKSGTSVFFSVNDGDEVEVITNLPPATLGMVWADKWYTQNNAAKTITWFRHWVKGGFTP